MDLNTVHLLKLGSGRIENACGGSAAAPKLFPKPGGRRKGRKGGRTILVFFGKTRVPKWVTVKRDPLGAILGPSCAILGPSWGHFGEIKIN